MTSDPIDDFEADVLPAGTPIGGFTVQRVLGKGGFGITYAARNRVTERSAAIKEFFPSRMARRDSRSGLIYSRDNAETVTWALRKFEETTRTLCDLAHPNIVRVFDYVPANNTGYMVMELLDGATLKDHLRSRAVPPRLDELRALLDPVMEALAYVHGRGLIHRDIAPDNILITHAGRPVLIDFGAVSRDLGDAADVSSTVGLAKRYYTAPEQMRARARPTPAGDVYSMGAVLYRALSGHDPADGQERVDTMFLSQQADPYRPLAHALPPGCRPQAAQAIDQALALRATDRQASIALLRAQLGGPDSGPSKPATTKPATTVVGGLAPPRARSLVQRVPVDVLAVVTAAVSSLLCVGYSQLLWPLIKDWLPDLLGQAMIGSIFGLSLAAMLMLVGRRHPGRLALLVLLTTVGWWVGYVGCGRALGVLTKVDPKDQLVWSLYYILMSLCGSAGTLAGCAIAERASLGWRRTAAVVASAAALSAALGFATAWVIDVLNFGVYLLICFYTWQSLVILGIVRGRYPSHGSPSPQQ